MTVKKEFPIKIGYNLDEVKKELREIKTVIAESEKIQQSGGALPSSITKNQKKGLIQRQQSKKGRGLYKDKSSASSTAGITSDNIIRKIEREQKATVVKLKKVEDDLKEEKKKLKEEQKKRKQQAAQIKKEQDQLQREIKQNEADVQNIITNPVGFGKGKLQEQFKLLAKLSVAGAFAQQFIDFVIERIQKEYGPGGRNDLRKLVRNQIFDYLSISNRIERNRGEVYFPSQHNAPLYQGAPGISNTENLADGHLKDILIDPGR